LLTDSFVSKKNFNLVIKNVDLFQKFHTVVVSNIKNDQSIKDLLRVLVKIYENVLKDISNNPSSQIHLNFSDHDFPDVPSDIHAMMFEEESIEKNTDNDIKSILYIFGIIGETLNAVTLDFASVVNTEKDRKSHNKSLGVKR
jgi:hypothetical protein